MNHINVDSRLPPFPCSITSPPSLTSDLCRLHDGPLTSHEAFDVKKTSHQFVFRFPSSS